MMYCISETSVLLNQIISMTHIWSFMLLSLLLFVIYFLPYENIQLSISSVQWCKPSVSR